ncbi:MAG: aldo/keto reductase [Thermoguttaceae bacterium]|nr:aldo/keto reductase [Thermoguttaceae bacterium]
MELRPLGDTDIRVSPISLGCWPMAGVTSPGANDRDSIAAIRACFELGINHLDTAHVYGRKGESERLIAAALGGRRDEMVIATKAGLCWNEAGKIVNDGRRESLRRQCEESLARLNTDRVELLYLHSPDPRVPLSESAGELKKLMEEGKTRTVGVSNVSLAQLQEFAAICPIAAYQPPYNMLQRHIEADTLPWCRRHGVAVMVYWPLFKGLLAGKLARDHVFAENDNRRKYAAFNGDEWQRNQDFLDRLREIARDAGVTVAALVVHWTISQPGITSALCGAKRPDQIRETAAAGSLRLRPEHLARVEQALAERGTPVRERTY